MYVEKTRTWDDNWNNVVRDVLWQDDKLKELMMIPEGTNILQFTEKHLIKGNVIGELLTNEPVRIGVYDKQGYGMRSEHVHGKYKCFDIYVNDKCEHTASPDRLKARSVLIAERLKYLLLKNRCICGLTFHYEDEYDLWTKTIGYHLYHIDFFYITST